MEISRRRARLVIVAAFTSLLIVVPLRGVAQATPAEVEVFPPDFTPQAAEVYPITFPVIGDVYYSDTFGACRDGCSRRHLGNDLMSTGRYKGRPVVAAHSGRVNWVSSNCCAISIDADDGIWSSWYIHLNNDEPFTDNGRGAGLAPGIVRGARVEEGQLIGWLGDSGNAEGVWPHLHFELRKYGTAINPHASLQAAKKTLVPRIAGATRYHTAVEISKTAYPGGADVAFVATGNNFPDALAGGPASVPEGGPILLVTPTTVPDATAAELERLDVEQIFVLGGESVVGPGVEAALGAYAPEVIRISGPNRYATAAAISETFFPSANVVYLASGTAFPDAVSGAPAAAKEGAPLLLTLQGRIPAETARELERLGPSEIVILGGTSVVGSEVEAAATAFAPTVTRLAGSSRYSTAAAIAARAHPTSATHAYLATGAGFVDALAGISVARMDDAPILLVSSTLPSSTAGAIESLGVEHPVILGGPLAVPTTVDSGLWSMVNDNDMPLWNNA